MQCLSVHIEWTPGKVCQMKHLPLTSSALLLYRTLEGNRTHWTVHQSLEVNRQNILPTNGWIHNLLHPKYQSRFLVRSWVQLALKPHTTDAEGSPLKHAKKYFLFMQYKWLYSYWREPSVVVVVVVVMTKNRKSNWWEEGMSTAQHKMNSCWFSLIHFTAQKREERFYWSGMN